MLNVIDFLERAGRDAQLRYASQADMELALMEVQIEPELQAAIVSGDQTRLGALLESQPLFCMQFPGKEDEEEEGDEDDTEDTPSREDGKMVSPSLSCGVAAVA